MNKNEIIELLKEKQDFYKSQYEESLYNLKLYGFNDTIGKYFENLVKNDFFSNQLKKYIEGIEDFIFDDEIKDEMGILNFWIKRLEEQLIGHSNYNPSYSNNSTGVIALQHKIVLLDGNIELLGILKRIRNKFKKD